MNRMIHYIPHTVVCKAIQVASKDFRVDFATYYSKTVRQKTTNLCAGTNKNAKSTATAENFHVILTRVYNLLPIAFQCNILRLIVFQVYGLPENKCENLLQLSEPKRKTFNDRTQLVENKLRRRFSIMPVSSQCNQIFAGSTGAYADTLKISFSNIKTGIESIKNTLQSLVPKLVESFYEENRISLPEVNSFWKDRMTNKFFLHYSSYEEKDLFTIKAKLFYALNGEPPQSAHLVLASIYSYGIEKFERSIEASVKITLESKSPSAKVRFERFPDFLVNYFNGSSECEKCTILKSTSLYSNKSMSETVHKLQVEKKISNHSCAQFYSESKYNDNIVLNKTKSNERRDGALLPLQHKIDKIKVLKLPVTKMAVVEILMIISLCFVFVFGVAFFATLAIFIKRRREGKINFSNVVILLERQ